MVWSGGQRLFRNVRNIYQSVQYLVAKALNLHQKQGGYLISHVDTHFNRNKRHKGKAIPLQALTDPASTRKLRLPYFKTIGT